MKRLKNQLLNFDQVLRISMEHRTQHLNWLDFMLGDELNLDQARSIVSSIASGWSSARSPESGSEDSATGHIEEKALELLKTSGIDEDYDLLLPIALKQSNPRRPDLPLFFRGNETARRKLFLAGLDSDPERSGNSIWFAALIAADIDWLFSLLRDRRNDPPWLLDTLYYFLYENETNRSLRARIRRRLRRVYPSEIEQLDKGRERREQWASRRKKPEPTYDLAGLIMRILSLRRLDLRQRMLNISRLCFTEPQNRPTNLKGHWEDLPESLRREATEVCAEALIMVEPTPIPNQSSFPSSILWEAACFNYMINEEENFCLDSAVIRKWLPALLRVYESDWESTLRRCHEVDPGLCEDIALDAIGRELTQSSETIFIVQQLPPDLWRQQLAERILTLVWDEKLRPAVRIYLLDRVARVFPEMCRPVAQKWATMGRDDERSLKYAGVDVLLAIHPTQGWPCLEHLLESEQPKTVLLGMRSLQPNHYGPSARFESWPAELLGRLADLLFQTFPPPQDPVRELGRAYSLGGEDDLISLRDNIAPILFRRISSDSQEILNRLSASYPRVKEWLDYSRAQRDADSFLEDFDLRLPAGQGAGNFVARSQIVKLLQDSRYRLLRSQDDLQAVVLEELQAISEDAAHHLGMLYRSKREKSDKREHLHEEALQAYLDCRLNDRLRTALNPVPHIVFLNREPLAARNTRNDLKIQTHAHNRQALEMVIEIKWSDNPDVSTSLIEQLAQEYLLKNGITHGIYFVGWCGVPGTWRGRAVGKRPRPWNSLAAWRTSLDQQIKFLLKEHPELSVVPFIIDLSWNLKGRPN